MKIIYTYGAFDILHLGHINLLKKAKELGDYLIVGIVGDNAIKKLKGKDRPLKDEKTRGGLIKEFKFVDEVIYQKGYDPDKYLINIRKKYPLDELILTKGDDWEYIPGQETIKKIGGILIKLPYTKECSSSEIIGRMKR